jgi:catechol 2,3-dioxygenase-like lactoylglutathione lyase family enzyme
VKARRLVPMAAVSSIARSVEFYGKLGFEVANTFTPAGAPAARWASLRYGDAELMITAAEAAGPARPSILFYLYCDDVALARMEIEAAGVACGAIRYPFYSPRGEFEVRDPDGYTVVVAHT